MRRPVCIAVILLLLGGCFLTGKKGDTGASGSSGPTGSPGQDAVVSTDTYEFNSVGNPYQKSVPVLSLTDFESGKQTVEMYTLWDTGEWYKLPHSFEAGGSLYEFMSVVGSQFVEFETYKDGVVAGGNANLGSTTRVIIKTFNK